MDEKSKIKCYVLGECEIFLGCGEGQRSIGGIGFIVADKWSNNIISCRLQSARIGVLMLKLGKRKTLKVIQVYAPTSASDDEDIEVILLLKTYVDPDDL
ncbi:hypothetical protein Y032_0050g1894 [Ancylostoma ceylanicum]|uniref:Uncharacterized protein n=1 Tax=Ancylostoma ceylanicum TaxID=53326 RepID=A0A016U963_9BILA|nr:hypothetical protein Y032_0050g1894 [Ancylostoma ceylanicum]